MKKHKEKIKIGIVIGVFSVVIIACLVSIFSQVFTEYKENESFKNLAEIVTEESTGNDTEKEQFINPNLLKVSDCDNDVQDESSMYFDILRTSFNIRTHFNEFRMLRLDKHSRNKYQLSCYAYTQ